MKGRLVAIIYLFIVRLPKGLELSNHTITVFFLSLSEYTLSMLFHICELYLISYLKWLANEGLNGHFVSVFWLFRQKSSYIQYSSPVHLRESIIVYMYISQLHS